ncbi:hypothetical protein OC861_002182 [Tilletia horrida]|nr:hypothetical protein OC861_002182 [Tilletia horrida]
MQTPSSSSTAAPIAAPSAHSLPLHARSVSSGLAFPSTNKPGPNPNQARPWTAADSPTRPALSLTPPARPPRSRSRKASLSAEDESPVITGARLQREANQMVGVLPSQKKIADHIVQSSAQGMQQQQQQLQHNAASINIDAPAAVTPATTPAMHNSSLPAFDDSTYTPELGTDRFEPASRTISARTSMISSHTSASAGLSTASASTHRTSSVVSTAPSTHLEETPWTSPRKPASSLPQSQPQIPGAISAQKVSTDSSALTASDYRESRDVFHTPEMSRDSTNEVQQGHADPDLAPEIYDLPNSRRPSLGGLRRYASSSELAADLAISSFAVTAAEEGDPQKSRPASTQYRNLTPRSRLCFPDQGNVFDPHWYTGATLLSHPRQEGGAEPGVRAGRPLSAILDHSRPRPGHRVSHSLHVVNRAGLLVPAEGLAHAAELSPSIPGRNASSSPESGPLRMIDTSTSPTRQKARQVSHGSKASVSSSNQGSVLSDTSKSPLSPFRMRRTTSYGSSNNGEITVPPRSSSRMSFVNEAMSRQPSSMSIRSTAMAQAGRQAGASATSLGQESPRMVPGNIDEDDSLAASNPTTGIFDPDSGSLVLSGRNDGSVQAHLEATLPSIASQVRVLDLSGCGLTEIPQIVLECTSLIELNVSANPITTLPASIASMAHLQVLVADYCELHFLPYALSELSHTLMILSVRWNKLTHLPSWLHLLHGLERLHLEGNPWKAHWRFVLQNLIKTSAADHELLDGTESLEQTLGDLTIAPASHDLHLGIAAFLGGASTSPNLAALQSSAFSPSTASRHTHSHTSSASSFAEATSPDLRHSIDQFKSPIMSPGRGSPIEGLGAPFVPVPSDKPHVRLDRTPMLPPAVDDEETEEVLSEIGDGAEESAHSVKSPSLSRSTSVASFKRLKTQTPESDAGSELNQTISTGMNSFLSTDPSSRASKWKFFRKGAGRKSSSSGARDFDPAELRSNVTPGRSSRPSSSSGGLGGAFSIRTHLPDFDPPPASPSSIATKTSVPDTPSSATSFFSVRRARKASVSRIGEEKPALDHSMSLPGNRTPLTATGSSMPLPEAIHRLSPMSPFPRVRAQKRMAEMAALADPNRVKRSRIAIDGEEPSVGSTSDNTSPLLRHFQSSAMMSLTSANSVVSQAPDTWPEHYLSLQALMHYLQDLDDLGPERPHRQINNNVDSEMSSHDSSESGTASPATVEGSDSSLRSASIKSRPTSMVPSVEMVAPAAAPAQESAKYKDSASLRSKILSEIVSTEETYVTLLAELVEIYVRPARRPWDGSSYPPVPTAEQRAVFGNVDALLSFHQGAFLPALMKAVEPLTQNEAAKDDLALTASVVEATAEVFTAHAAYLRAYVPYVNGAEEAQSRIMNWRMSSSSSSNGTGASRYTSSLIKSPSSQSNSAAHELTSSQRKRARAFLKRCREHPKHSQLSLESYLLLPVQRIPRYRLLLEELRKATPPERLRDPKATTRALELVSSMATSVNESKRQSEQDRRLLQWQHRIRGKWPSPLVQPHRRFVREGDLLLRRVVKREMSFTLDEDEIAAAGWTTEEMMQDCAIATRGQKVVVDYLHQQSLSKSITLLLCNDLIALVAPLPAHAGEAQDVELYGVLHLRGDRPVEVVATNNIRVVDTRSILYFTCKSESEAQSWTNAMNQARIAARRP